MESMDYRVHGLSKWRMTLIWCVVVATDSNTCVRAALVLKPGTHVPTAYQIVLDAAASRTIWYTIKINDLVSRQKASMTERL